MGTLIEKAIEQGIGQSSTCSWACGLMGYNGGFLDLQDIKKSYSVAQISVPVLVDAVTLN